MFLLNIDIIYSKLGSKIEAGKNMVPAAYGGDGFNIPIQAPVVLNNSQWIVNLVKIRAADVYFAIRIIRVLSRPLTPGCGKRLPA